MDQNTATCGGPSTKERMDSAIGSYNARLELAPKSGNKSQFYDNYVKPPKAVKKNSGAARRAKRIRNSR